MQTTDSEKLFRTDAELLTEQRRHGKQHSCIKAQVGYPLELSSKLLALKMASPDETLESQAQCWIAESGSVIRSVNLLGKSGEKEGRIFRGHKGPVTAVCELSMKDTLGGLYLASAGWDKRIIIWDVLALQSQALTSWDAHRDFVKCLLFVPEHALLISGGGGSDRDIRIWDVGALSSSRPAACVAHLTGYHTRGVQCLARLPLDDGAERETSAYEFSFISGDSLGVIKVWTMKVDSKDKNSSVISVLDLRQHDTSVYDLQAVGCDSFFSASADKTARRWHKTATREGLANWQVDLVLRHSDHVKTMVYIGQALGSGSEYLLTGCSDEDIYIWSLTLQDGDGPDSSRLLRRVSGHFHEVSSLVVFVAPDRNLQDAMGDADKSPQIVWIASGSLDGTIRRWRLKDLLTPNKNLQSESPKATATAFEMTEEEEADLERLMEDV